MDKLEELVKEIKKKKELEGIDSRVVIESIHKNFPNLSLSSNQDKKIVIKIVRAELRKLSGRFEKPQKKDLAHEDIALVHSSTRERADFYPQLKELIHSLKVKSIIDLGCGINPIMIAEKGMDYYALDINTSDLKLVDEFFAKESIKGKTFFYDLRKIDSSLPKADLALIFKVFDVLESKGHKLAEKIINSLNSKYILISFSTKTLSGRPMNHPQRGWIEHLLKRLNFTFEIIKSKNEIFYLATRN